MFFGENNDKRVKTSHAVTVEIMWWHKGLALLPAAAINLLKQLAHFPPPKNNILM